MKNKFLLSILVWMVSPVVWAQTVNFSGVVNRAPGDSAEHSLLVELDVISDPYTQGSATTLPITIPAGRSSSSYSVSVPWSDADAGLGYFVLDLRCVDGCEQGNARTGTIHFRDSQGGQERFGEGERRSAYIADFTLIHKYSFLRGEVSLPTSQPAVDALEVEVFIDRRWGFSDIWFLTRFTQTVRIERGQTTAPFRIPVTLAPYGSGRTYSIMVGYRCVSAACQAAGLSEQAWMVKQANANPSYQMTTAVSSAYGFTAPDIVHGTGLSDLNGLIALDQDSYEFSLPAALSLVKKREIQISLSRGRFQENSTQLRGRVLVYKQQHMVHCGLGQDYGVWTGAREDCELDNLVGLGLMPDGLQSESVLVSSTEFAIQAGQASTTLAVNVEPLNQSTAFLNESPSDADTQTIAIICDSGCGSLQEGRQYFAKSGHLVLRESAKTGSFSLSSEPQPRQISLSLLLAMPWLDLVLGQ